MKAITKKLLELGAKSTNVKTMLKKLPVSERKKWEGKESFIVKDLAEIEAKEESKRLKRFFSFQAKKHNLSLKEYMSLKEKAKNILESFHTDHSMGCYRDVFINGKKFAENHALDDYAKSCKYKPTYGNIQINFTKKELRSIQNIEGVWTIVNEDHSAKWLMSSGMKQSHDIYWKDGFLIGTSHAPTIEEARRLEKQKSEIKAIREANEKKFVGVRHILATGACMDGIKAFCNRHNLNMDFGYRLGYLLSLKDSFSHRYLNSVR